MGQADLLKGVDPACPCFHGLGIEFPSPGWTWWQRYVSVK